MGLRHQTSIRQNTAATSLPGWAANLIRSLRFRLAARLRAVGCVRRQLERTESSGGQHRGLPGRASTGLKGQDGNASQITYALPEAVWLSSDRQRQDHWALARMIESLAALTRQTWLSRKWSGGGVDLAEDPRFASPWRAAS